MSENVVLCASNAYDRKYYFNPAFRKLPEDVKKELKIISVMFTEEVGGLFMMEFTPERKLEFKTEAKNSDYNYDDIGAALKIKQIRQEHGDMLRAVELFYRVLICGENIDDIED